MARSFVRVAISVKLSSCKGKVFPTDSRSILGENTKKLEAKWT